MSAERWIVIPNWDGETGFQHYKDRTPIWIKNYTELMSDGQFLALTLHQRGVLHGLWMEYARARRQIPDSTLTISRRLGERVTRTTLNALNHAGFITYSASKPLATPAQDASPEKSREEKNPPTPLPGEQNRRTPEQRQTDKKRGKPPRYLAGVQPIWNAAPPDEREHEARIWLEGFTSDEDEVQRHLDHLRTQEAA